MANAAGGAGAAGAGGAGAAGGAAGGAGGKREPDLLTHQSYGGYDYYSGSGDQYDWDDWEDDYSSGAPNTAYAHQNRGAWHDGDDPDREELFESEQDSAKARRKVIFRRVRRTCYVAAALIFLLVTGFFIYGYMTWDIRDPAAVAEGQSKTVTINYSNGNKMTQITPQGGARTMVHDLHGEIPQQMLDASMAAEDASFYSNWGFDPIGILRAAVTGSGGGSTITQQYIKLQTDQDQHTYSRKFKEVVLALKMTNQQEKDDILKAYLNTADYGRGAHGINSAAKAYFGKTPKQLTPDESALLAGMVQNPYKNDPRLSPEKGESRYKYVSGQMAANFPGKGYGTNQMPTTLPRSQWRGEAITPAQYQIRQQVEKELSEKGYPENELTRGGFTITTTIDEQAQKAAEEAVNKAKSGMKAPDLHASLVATDPKNGQVRAYYGGGDQVGGLDYAGRPQPPGSSFKPFVALAGLQQGIGIGERYDGSSPQVIAGTPFENSEQVGCDPDPLKECSVREAMTNSVNTVFLNMANKFKPGAVSDAAHAAGIPQKDPSGKPTLQNPDGSVSLGVALGMYPVKPVDMANAYGTIANKGQRNEVHFVSRIDSHDKHESFDAKPPVPAWGPDSERLAGNVIDSMREVANHSKIGLDKNRPVASKTGTQQLGDTNMNQNAWMVGATPQISAAVAMLAGDGNAPLKDNDGTSIYGGETPGEIWQSFMNAYHRDKPMENFPKPAPIGQFEKKQLYTPPPPPPPEEPSTTMPPSESSMPSEPSESSESSSSKSRPTAPGGRPCGSLFNPCPSGGSDSEDGGFGAGGSSGVESTPTRRPGGH